MCHRLLGESLCCLATTKCCRTVKCKHHLNDLNVKDGPKCKTNIWRQQGHEVSKRLFDNWLTNILYWQQTWVLVWNCLVPTFFHTRLRMNSTTAVAFLFRMIKIKKGMDVKLWCDVLDPDRESHSGHCGKAKDGKDWCYQRFVLCCRENCAPKWNILGSTHSYSRPVYQAAQRSTIYSADKSMFHRESLSLMSSLWRIIRLYLPLR